jgi:phospholipid transport system transporter-binding protein
MATAQLTSTGAGRFALQGEVGFATATGLLTQGRILFGEHRDVEVDLSGVTHADSAGLALLVEWLRLAHQGHTRLTYRQLPEQLRTLAGISDVGDLLAGTG